MRLRHLLSTTACLLSSAAALAHEGHGSHDDVLDVVFHWFTQWDHLAVLLVVAVAAGLGARALNQSKKDKKVRR
jgi:hydrogenase/urease accessory protein HupE